MRLQAKHPVRGRDGCTLQYIKENYRHRTVPMSIDNLFGTFFFFFSVCSYEWKGSAVSVTTRFVYLLRAYISDSITGILFHIQKNGL